MDNTFGGPGYRFDRVFVVDHPVSDAADVSAGDGTEGPPFTDDERQVLREAVADLADLEGVGSEDEVPGSDTSAGIVPHSTVVSLGPVEFAGETHVGIGMYCGNVCGDWVTYVVAETPSGWEVTGDTGVAAIS